MEMFNFSSYLNRLLASPSMREEYSGDSLKRRRKKFGLTQEALADLIGVERPSVSYWENGTNQPKPENIAKLLMVFAEGYYKLLDEAWREIRVLKQKIREMEAGQDE